MSLVSLGVWMEKRAFFVDLSLAFLPAQNEQKVILPEPDRHQLNHVFKVVSAK